MGSWRDNERGEVPVILEWRSSRSVPEDLTACLATIAATIPTDGDVNRPEEVRTLPLAGVCPHTNGQLLGLVYESSRHPINLRDVLLRIEKPSVDERRILGGIIAT